MWLWTHSIRCFFLFLLLWTEAIKRASRFYLTTLLLITSRKIIFCIDFRLRPTAIRRTASHATSLERTFLAEDSLIHEVHFGKPKLDTRLCISVFPALLHNFAECHSLDILGRYVFVFVWEKCKCFHISRKKNSAPRQILFVNPFDVATIVCIVFIVFSLTSLQNLWLAIKWSVGIGKLQAVLL